VLRHKRSNQHVFTRCERQYTGGGSGERFWYNYFAGNRVGQFERLQQTVRRVLDAGNPVEL
jgi:hypothetical protein